MSKCLTGRERLYLKEGRAEEWKASWGRLRAKTKHVFQHCFLTRCCLHDTNQTVMLSTWHKSRSETYFKRSPFPTQRIEKICTKFHLGRGHRVVPSLQNEQLSMRQVFCHSKRKRKQREEKLLHSGVIFLIERYQKALQMPQTGALFSFPWCCGDSDG